MKTTSRWRPVANRIITGIIAANPKADDAELRKLIREAYPWGERAYHPYKIWCDEVNQCMMKAGKKQPPVSNEINLFNQPK